MQVYLSFGNGSCCFFPGELRTRKVRIIRVVDRGNLHMCKQWLWWLKGKQRLLHGNTQLSDLRSIFLFIHCTLLFCRTGEVQGHVQGISWSMKEILKESDYKQHLK
nr:uncharacterized protein LOC109782115 isoform X2 [Aegilops tauschii subsp. strangulata]